MAPDVGSRGLAVAAILIVLALLECSTVCGASPGNLTDSATANASVQISTPAPQTKEKRSQEDIMFGNQQNKPAGGMVDDLFQAPEPQQRNNNTQHGKGPDSGSKEPDKETVSQHQRQSLSELPDYYDYIQPEASESLQQTSPSATAEEDDEDEEVDRAPAYASQDQAAFGSQRLLPAVASQMQGASELVDYPSSEDDFEGSSLLYRRRKRGTSRHLRSPLEDLLSPSGGTFRRRRASPSSPMRLKRDAASNELLTWLLRMNGPAAVAGPRRKNLIDDEMDIQEYQGPEPEALEVSSVPAYLYDQLGEDEDEEEEGGLPASLLESLALQEEGEEWEPPVRGPARRRSSFYPLDYRYVLLPGARKRSGGGFMGVPSGHFGAMRENNRWPGEPQSGRWGHFPLRPVQQQQQQQFLRGPVQFQQQQQQPMGVMRRRAPMQESDADRLYALASLLASQEGQDNEDKRRRRRSPAPAAPLKG